ncbi:MAG TPA: 50S ribosomal protein L23 [Bacilli bacterium]|nr:50S ribosomal protein L23 [Bacilli bacterium]
MNLKYLDVIKAPVITEKSGSIAQNNGKYSFYVDPKSNKTEIKLAIEKKFNVNVIDVRTVNVHPKKRRVNGHTGLTNRKKKAIVTIKDGQTIEF